MYRSDSYTTDPTAGMSIFLSTVPFFVSSSSTFTTALNIKQCATAAGCTAVKKRIALDSLSNHTSASGASLISVGGAGMDALTMTYGGASVGGPRVYLIEDEGVNKNYMFMLKGQEFTFDVELSSMPCGFNAALYFVGMDANAGGAESGTNYCDAQAVAGTFCSEMDILEANTEAQQYTTHACVDTCGTFAAAPQCKGTPGSQSSVCDQSGCGLNPFRYGPGTTYNNENDNAGWYGPGAATHLLDSTQPFTVVTQFNTAAGSGGGELNNITRFYVQKGKRVDLPALYVIPPSGGGQSMGGFTGPAITKAYCTDIYDRWNGEGVSDAPLAQMGKNMESGMVLAMSAWYAQETYSGGKPQGGTQTGMSWLDGTNNWGKFVKAGPCDTTTTDSAGPYHATFSNIRIGDIGSTNPFAPTPAPGPTPPTPTPPTPPTPPPTPTPPPPGPTPPGPVPSGCPGGSLSACIGLCPSTPPVAYQDCVQDCVERCS